VPERGSVAVDEETPVLVDGRRHRAAEHGAEHRARIARQSGACRRVSLAADVQPYQLVHRPTRRYSATQIPPSRSAAVKTVKSYCEIRRVI